MLSVGSRSRSRVLMAGQRREIGREEDPRWRGLSILGIRMIVTRFQIEGMSAACFDKL